MPQSDTPNSVTGAEIAVCAMLLMTAAAALIASLPLLATVVGTVGLLKGIDILTRRPR